MAATPIAADVLKSLRKKSANIRFMCKEVRGAAVAEGSCYFQTRALSSITQEAQFHRRLAQDLPAVEQLTLPVQIKKKLKYKKFGSLAYNHLMPCLTSFVVYRFAVAKVSCVRAMS